MGVRSTLLAIVFTAALAFIVAEASNSLDSGDKGSEDDYVVVEGK